MRMVKGLANDHAARIIAARAQAPFVSLEDVWLRSGVPATALERLADADAFAGLGLDRRQALWRVRGLGESPLPLFAAADAWGAEPSVGLTAMTDGREVVEDCVSLRLSLRAHPVAFLRPELERRRIAGCGDLARMKDGARVEVAGIVLIRQRPGAGNVTFITIEDESGIANIILWQRRFEAQRRIVMSAAMLGIKGILQREGDVIHIIAERLEDLTPLLDTVGRRDFPHRYANSDAAKNGGGSDRRVPERRARAESEDAIRIKSRNFH
jgi:error-prone DNA polymerase